MTNLNQRPQGHSIHSSQSILATLSSKATQGPKNGTANPPVEVGHRPRYLRLPEVRRLVPLSPATIWRKTRDGSFPPAIKISSRVTAWRREAVEAWLAQKEAA